MRRAALAVTLALLASACEVEGTIGSLKPLSTALDASDVLAQADVVLSMDARADAGDGSLDGGSEGDAAADALADVRQRETSTPESPNCNVMGGCPLARFCSRTLCQAPWAGCDEDEKCNGLDDDCDGVADNDINCGSGDPCPAGQARCAGECVDITRSTMHCGRCDRPCPADRCYNGYCEPRP
jgi:hypothetical protein